MRKFIVNGYMAFSEQDNFNEGCYGPAKNEFASAREFTRTNTTLDGLIADLCKELRAESESVLINSCSEIGRVDIQVTQREPFRASRVSENTMAEFRAGTRDLWATTYTFSVRIEETDFDLVPYLTNPNIYTVEQ